MNKEKIIILLCDTLRAKSMPHYGNTRNTIPNLTPFIEEEFIVYKRAYAPAPWTTPSHLSLFSGLYPSQVMETPASFSLDPVFKTLPELFKDSGYKTFAVSCNELVSKGLGFAKGCDIFLQLWLPDPKGEEIFLDLKATSDFDRALKVWSLLLTGRDRKNILKALRIKIYKRYKSISKNATPSTNRAMGLLKKYILQNKDQKVFCFINLMQVHNLYNPPRITRNKFIKDNSKLENYWRQRSPIDHYAVEPFSEELIEYIQLLYEEELLYLDLVIADFINFLKNNNLYDSCTLIITSDHGEHFGENGHIQHHFSVYEPLIRIPLYIKWRGKSDNISKFNDRLIMLQDLYSTFLNLLNHWQPVPDSSFDLTSSEKRPWVVSQLPDITKDIKFCQQKRKSFSIKEIELEDTSLTSYVFDNGTKIIENGSKILRYNLKSDPDEKSSYPVTEEDRLHIQNIKVTL